jgi:peptide/nickel transport system substrate-binding protein
MPTKISRRAVLAGTSITALYAVAGSPAAQAATKPSLIMTTGSDFSSLDPDKYVTGQDYLLYGNMFEGLYGLDANSKLAPALAEKCDVSADGLAYTFTLRPGAVWHNGDSVTTDDVIFSINRTLDPGRNSRAAFIADNIAGIDRIDDKHFVVRLKAVDALTVEKLGLHWQVKPKAYIEKVGDDGFARQPIGSGPFEFVERRPGQHVKMKAFEKHWGRVPKVADVTVRIAPEEQGRLAQVMAGESDVVWPLSPILAGRLGSQPNLQVLRVPTYLNILIKFNGKHKELSKRGVRQAFCMAIDRAQLFKTMVGGYGEQEELWCSGGQTGCSAPVAPYPYDPKRARALLEESQFDFATPVKFAAMAPGRVAQSKETAEVITEYLQRVGVKVDLNVIEYGAWTKIHSAKEKDPTVAMLFAVAPDPSQDVAYRLQTQIASTGAFTWASLPEIDDKLKRINNFTDLAEREKFVGEILKTVHDEALVLPLWALNTIYVANKAVDFKIPPFLSAPLLWNVTKKA